MYQSKKITLLIILFCIQNAHTKTKNSNIDDLLHQQRIRHDTKLQQGPLSFQDTDHSKDTQSYHHYFIANYNHSSGNIQQALLQYKKILTENPSIYIYEGYLKLLFDVGLFAQVIDTIEKKKEQIQPLLNKSVELQLIIAQAYLHAGKDDEASTRFSLLAKEFPNNEQVAYYSIISLMKKGSDATVLSEIKKQLANEQLRSKHFLFYFLESKIYLQQRKLINAQQAIEKSLELFPKFERGWLFKALLMEQQGNINDAIHGYQRFLSLVGREESIEKQLIQLLFSQEKYEEAANYLKRIDSDSAEYYFDLALIYFKGNNVKKALQAVNQSINKDRNFQQARLLKIEILARNNKTGELAVFLEDWMTEENYNQSPLHVLLLLKQQLHKSNHFVRALEHVIKKDKGSDEHIALLADLYSESGEHKKAIEQYNALLSKSKDQQLKTHILLHIAHEQTALNQHPQAEKTLEKAMSLKSDDPAVHNMLAYHYAHHNKRIDEAFSLINKALEKAPQVGHYLDTKGYILLKQGNKQEAQVFFKQALELDPHDNVIQEHIKMCQ